MVTQTPPRTISSSFFAVGDDRAVDGAGASGGGAGGGGATQFKAPRYLSVKNSFPYTCSSSWLWSGGCNRQSCEQCWAEVQENAGISHFCNTCWAPRPCMWGGSSRCLTVKYLPSALET